MIGIGRWCRLVLIGLPFAWLGLFFLLPLLIVVKISLARSAIGIPPYTPLLLDDGSGLKIQATLANFAFLASDDLYLRAYLGALGNAALATALCLALGYPISYAIARSPGRWRLILLFLVMLPFWTSFLIRVYAWIAILKPNGLLNQLLIAIGLITTPLPLLNNAFSVELGLVYSYLPFMILPLYGSLTALDESLLEAAADLGARPIRAFLGVTLPLSLPGIAAGSLLVLIPAIGEFVIPDLLGGADTLMIGKVLWDEFFNNRDWPVASAVAVVLVLYSFNASRLVTVWAGFSTRWYGELAKNEGFRAAALTSLEVALMAASLALVLGTFAGFSMARFSRFPGRSLFGFALMAPLVVPEVILGLSLLLMFVAGESVVGWPQGRGIVTITIAHATFGACFVSVLVRAQLAGFDRALEEAALDLGARPWTVLARITLPGISPALVSGWLLAFTLSLDDLVIASFVTGPSATTLPMMVFSSVRLGVSPEVNALASLFLAVVFVLVSLAFWLMARAERRRIIS